MLLCLVALCCQMPFYAKAGTILIDTSASMPLRTHSFGVNMAFMYGHIDADEMDSTEVKFIHERYSTALAEAIGEYYPGILRFPGGTVGNYYHFYRAGGYGSDTLDLLCKELTIPGTYPSWYVNDRKYSKNFIEPYVQLNDYLRGIGREPSTLYVVNLTGPIYKGSLIPLNDPIKSFFQSQLGSNYAFFEQPVSALDTLALKAIANYTYTIFNEPGMKQFMKTVIGDNPTVQLAIRENMDAIRYLMENGISIAGIELGNELLSDYLLFDDDLSSNTFTCEDLYTLPPEQIPAPTLTINLPAIEVVTGMIKIWMIAELLQDSIRTFLDAPYGFPFEFPYSYMQATPEGDIFRVQPYGGLFRLAYLWNQFWTQHDRFDAVILHTYMQGLLDCNAFLSHSIEFLSDIGKLYTRFFAGEFLDADMEEMYRYVGDREIWITEWNMNQAQLLGATFTHSTFVSEYFMHMLRRKMANPDKFRHMVYHNMNNGGTSKYALFTTQKTNVFGDATVRRQMAWYPHHLLSSLRQRGFQYIDLSLSQMMAGEGNEQTFRHSVFIHPSEHQLAIWYINYSADTLYIHTGRDSISFGGGGPYLMAIAEEHTAIRAAGMLSSNDPCALSPIFTDTSFVFGDIPITGSDSIAIPPLSVGTITFRLDQVSSARDKTIAQKLNIYPNPGRNTIYISIPGSEFRPVATWQLTNSTGQQVSAPISNTAHNTYRIDITIPGYYHIRAFLSDGTSVIGSLVVQ